VSSLYINNCISPHTHTHQYQLYFYFIDGETEIQMVKSAFKSWSNSHLCYFSIMPLISLFKNLQGDGEALNVLEHTIFLHEKSSS
jgi:hypothetical protein